MPEAADAVREAFEQPSDTVPDSAGGKTGDGPRVQSLRALAAGTPPDARLLLTIEGDLPSMGSRWDRLVVRPTLHARGREYAASNMRRLVETGYAAGGMRLSDFTPQAQRAMRVLVQRTSGAGPSLVLTSPDVAELFHCLVGYGSLACGAGQIHIHAQQAELALVAKSGAQSASVTPRLVVPGRGMLPPAGLRHIAGRAGCWVGVAREYWWLPGVLDMSWGRLFVRGEPVSMTANDVSQLAAMCARGDFPARLIPGDPPRQIVEAAVPCQPVATFDWGPRGLRTHVCFRYGAHRLAVTGPPVCWSGGRFTARDSDGEQRALARLSRAGFTRVAGAPGSYRLGDPGRILAFVTSLLPELETEWEVYGSQTFVDRRRLARAPRLEVEPVREGKTWFELGCRLAVEGYGPLPFEDVAAAVRRKESYVVLEPCAVVPIPPELHKVLASLLERAERRTDARLRFSRYSAVAVEDLVEPYLADRDARWLGIRQRLSQPPATDRAHLPDSLAGVLREYQKEGVAWLSLVEDSGVHGILADEMGLGKTVQALVAVARRKEAGGEPKVSLVVCPTSLVQNWLLEARRFTPQLRATTIQGTGRRERIAELGRFDLVITSYALLRRDVDLYREHAFDYVILDEAQHIKNPETANARTCKQLRSEHRLILTGTPLENSLREVWSLFDFLLPGLLGSLTGFRRTYESPAPDGESAQAAQALAAHIRPFVLRRTKAEVCKQLPPKLEQTMYCDLYPEQEQLYATFLAAGRNMLGGNGGGGWQESRFELLALLMRLRQVCCHPRLLPEDMRPETNGGTPSAKTDLLQEVLFEAMDSGHRLLLFSQFTSFLKLFRAWLDEQQIAYEYLDGQTKDRMERVQRFNRDADIPVFLLSLRAGGTGLNLTGADMVVHYDQWWNPMVEDQATDRSHRIGQERPVTSLKLIARGTIEEKILSLQASKRELFNQVMAGVPSGLGELSGEDMEFLLGAEGPDA